MLTVLHAGGKFDKGSYKVSGGLHDVGVSCVNALSTLLIAEIHRDGKIFRQSYSKGAPTSPVEVIGTCDDRGTTITFKPDGSIFTLTTEYKYDILANRLRELAFLNKGIHLNLLDKRQRDENGEYVGDHFYSEEGPQGVRRIPGRHARSGHHRIDHLHRHRKERRAGRGGHAVQRLLLGERTLLRQ